METSTVITITKKMGGLFDNLSWIAQGRAIERTRPQLCCVMVNGRIASTDGHIALVWEPEESPIPKGLYSVAKANKSEVVLQITEGLPAWPEDSFFNQILKPLETGKCKTLKLVSGWNSIHINYVKIIRELPQNRALDFDLFRLACQEMDEVLLPLESDDAIAERKALVFRGHERKSLLMPIRI